MGAKRALIVDDSKSARVFLARALEKFEIDVDSAESAEAAIEYLGRSRPDVIFMDHLMPGMDGFQAVRAIKSDPRTATIPIMMYTSQEGELYLGQARALGALGVLPKQTRPADVSKVLFQLHLLPERPAEEKAGPAPLNAPAEKTAPEPVATAVPSRPLTDSAWREHFAELRRALLAGIDASADRVIAEVRTLLAKSLPPPEAVTPPPRPAQPAWAWLIACAALAIALVSSVLAWHAGRVAEDLTAELTRLRQPTAQLSPAAFAGAAPAAPAATAAPTAAEAAPPSATAARTGVPPSSGRPMVLPVPFGADALGGARLEAIGRLLYRLARQNVAGLVDIRTFAGRFCLVGNALDGYSLAPEETPYSRCEIVGNPLEEALTSAPRTPLALANLISDIRASTHGALQVQVAPGDPASVVMPYPQAAADLTAGAWNRAGSANNRIEIRVR